MPSASLMSSIELESLKTAGKKITKLNSYFSKVDLGRGACRMVRREGWTLFTMYKGSEQNSYSWTCVLLFKFFSLEVGL